MSKPPPRQRGPFQLRAATPADVGELEHLIARSARELSQGDYRPAQVERALEGAFGVDSQLLADGTYFVVEEQGRIVACGGWSYRATLFGGDARAERDSSPLDPRFQPARIRAFFVEPAAARLGLGSMLLAHCEAAARARGFAETELMATLPGQRLYAARGYRAASGVRFDLGQGEWIDFIPMRKRLPTSE